MVVIKERQIPTDFSDPRCLWNWPRMAITIERVQEKASSKVWVHALFTVVSMFTLTSKSDKVFSISLLFPQKEWLIILNNSTMNQISASSYFALVIYRIFLFITTRLIKTNIYNLHTLHSNITFLCISIRQINDQMWSTSGLLYEHTAPDRNCEEILNIESQNHRNV